MRKSRVFCCLSPLLLSAVAFSFAGDGIEISERVVVTPDGARIQREYQSQEDGKVYQIPIDEGFMPEMVTDPRWIESDGGLLWICRDIAVGDNGAIVMASKGLNNEAVTLYQSTGPQPIWNFDTNGSEDPVVAVADRSNYSANMVVFDMDPGPDYDFEATVNFFTNTGTGVPEWSYVFPRTLNYYGGGVTVSDKGNVILAWKADPNIERLRVVAFHRDGTIISSSEIYTTYNGTAQFHSRQTRLSDNGSRAYFFIGVYAIIYDVATGTVEYEHNIGASFDSHALSGDGTHFAYGNFGYFRVYEESSPGNWAEVASDTFAGSTYVSNIDLNQDGSRLGYEIQRYSPAYDHIEIGMHDVNTNTPMFNVAYDAPGTAYQLHPSGVAVDDNGDYVAGISWGDSMNATPEGFVYDAMGNATCEIDARGSAFGIGFDADGDVFAMGCKGVHANEYGNGGDIIVADAYEQTLHLVGYAQVGATINLEVPAVGNKVQITVCDNLGVTGTPYGDTEVDLSSELRRLGPYTIPSYGLSLPLNIPNMAMLRGRDLHFQAVITGGGVQLTNKVSIRVQP